MIFRFSYPLLLFVMVCLPSEGMANDELQAGIQAFEQGKYQLARDHWLPMAKSDHAEAQLFMGVLYRYGLGVQKDRERSAHWYLQSAENGDVDAQNEIALLYELGWGVEQDIWKAAGWYQQVTDQDVCLSDTSPTGRLILDDSAGLQ
jgi:TPR repeat protein